MEAAGGIATSNSISRLPVFFPSINLKPSFRENLHSCSAFASYQVVHFQLLKSSSVSDGNWRARPLKRNYVIGRSSREDERRITQPQGSSSGKWSSQKRLLALFKRIETSISQGKSERTKDRNSESSEDYNVSSESVSEVLQQSARPRKGTRTTSRKHGDTVSSHKISVSETKKEPRSPDPQPPADFKLTRPPSNFMKKSPIPLPFMPKINRIELNAAETPDEGVGQEPLELEKMKVTELKELAKVRGIKGYSKLKKSELVDLLSTQARS